MIFARIRTLSTCLTVPTRKTSFSSVAPQAEWVKNSKGHEYFLKKENEKFEAFYRAQGICPDSEWPDLISAMRRPLPSVFRVVSTKPEYPHFVARLRQGRLPGVEEVEWFPGGRVWRVTVGNDGSRWDVRDNPQFQALHKFVDEQNRFNRNIYRQELVSMVPVLCLDVASHHTVLDMCASPGSKTQQVLEDMHMDRGRVPDGVVVANELDLSRCSNLVGNITSMNSPNVIVTRYDGQTFPEIMWTDDVGEMAPLRYDRIVCDVPCSGDGTIRKNPDIWESWSPVKGTSRHSLQYNIARRGLELLKVGGLMAYSSCSINQIENECVLARLLQEGDGKLELVDQTGKFPGLKWAPGLSTWSLFDSNMNEYPSFESVPENVRGSQICPEMFPPDRSIAAGLHLERSMRFLPHFNNDGGFFVAIIRKTGELNWPRTRRQTKIKTFNENLKNLPMKLKNLTVPRDSLHFLGNNEDIHLEKAKDFYGIDLKSDIFLSRVNNEDKKNSQTIKEFISNINPDIVCSKNPNFKVWLVSPMVKNILSSNSDDMLAVANAGMQVLQKEKRSSTAVKYKLLPASLHMISNHISKRFVSGTKADAVKLLGLPFGETASMSEFEDNFQNSLKDLGFGNFIFVCNSDDIFVICPGFCSKDKVFLDMSDRRRSHYSFLLNGD